MQAQTALSHDCLVERFMRFAPPFEGQADPSAAEKWLDEMWKRFALLFGSEEQKVSLATYILQRVVHH